MDVHNILRVDGLAVRSGGKLPAQSATELYMACVMSDWGFHQLPVILLCICSQTVLRSVIHHIASSQLFSAITADVVVEPVCVRKICMKGVSHA